MKILISLSACVITLLTSACGSLPTTSSAHETESVVCQFPDSEREICQGMAYEGKPAVD